MFRQTGRQAAAWISFLLVALLAAPAFAHLMLIEPEGDGAVRVIFDDGTANRHASVVVYNEKGEEIATGQVDRDGRFEFPPGEAASLVATDDFGHRAEYTVGEEPSAPLPRMPVVGGVLVVFVSLALFFRFRVNKKHKGEEVST